MKVTNIISLNYDTNVNIDLDLDNNYLNHKFKFIKIHTYNLDSKYYICLKCDEKFINWYYYYSNYNKLYRLKNDFSWDDIILLCNEYIIKNIIE